MTVKELKEALDGYPEDLVVVAQDGSDPSDLVVVTRLYHNKSKNGVGYLEIYADGDMAYYLES